MRTGKGESGSKGAIGLRIIAVGKLIKVVALLSLGIASLAAVGHDPPELLLRVAHAVGVHGGHSLDRLVASLGGVSSRQLEEVGFGAFVYAALFSVEGLGLWFRKKWAEYLTIVITLSFIPLEIYEIAHHTTAPKIVTLVLNVAALMYLVYHRVTSERRRSVPARLGIASH
jgi:uncharacterized membrane protein (DUF2068 family)